MEEKYFMLWLSLVPSLGIRKKLKLLDYFGNAKNIFTADPIDFFDINFLTKQNREKLISNKKENLIELAIEKLGTHTKFTTLSCSDYPPHLKNIYDPPIVLYYRGKIPQGLSISIIGTRRCSQYGKRVSYDLAKDLAKENIIIVSGMATGIDSYAHKGAVECGKTIAVLGCGVDICYPKNNRDLMEKIINNGCVISEYPLGTHPLPGYFPVRNRIISGISSGIIVVEASQRSGTLITVNQGLEQGKDIFAVPGSIWSKESQGTNNLIKEGAFLLTDYNDIINHYNINKELNTQRNEPEENLEFNNLNENECVIYRLINKEPKTINEICTQSNTTIDIVQYLLTVLEIKGLIEKVPGQRYIRI
ncbi:MAG: DNA-processing protein DprA [Lachnospirales bacterium]